VRWLFLSMIIQTQSTVRLWTVTFDLSFRLRNTRGGTKCLHLQLLRSARKEGLCIGLFVSFEPTFNDVDANDGTES